MRAISVVLAVVVCMVTSCKKDPHILDASVRFISHPSVVVDGGDLARVSGQLLIEVESDVDLEAISRDSHVWATASGCTSGTRTLAGIASLKGAKATILVPYMDRREPTYDLSRSPEPICVVVGVGSMSPFGNARSQPYRLDLDAGFVRAMKRYSEEGGEVIYSRIPRSESPRVP